MKTLIEIAKDHLSIKEIPDNQGFNDKLFLQRVESLGWKKGDSWCVFAVWVVTELYLTQYDTSLISEFRKAFSPSAVVTFNNFKKMFPEIVSTDPIENSIVIFQKHINGKRDWRGHAAIYLNHQGNYLTTIDGNTNKAGSREGDGFYCKTRKIDNNSLNGLHVMGFIKLPKFES